jgi:hypothetical protein
MSYYFIFIIEGTLNPDVTYLAREGRVHRGRGVWANRPPATLNVNPVFNC